MDILDINVYTPLFELNTLSIPERRIHIFGKCEFMNLSGSVKDRAARAMIAEGINSGRLTRDKTIIDATSGNTGIAYAVIGAALGYKVKLYMPANVTEERWKTMRAYGAETVLTPIPEGMEGAYRGVNAEVRNAPGRYFYPDQYTNEQNWLAHYRNTGQEILEQSGGLITHFVAGTGTAGTFMGCTKRLKEFSKRIQCYSMTPDSPFHGIEGLKHSSELSEGFFDRSIADGEIEISTETAYRYAKHLSRNEGLFVGISSGANAAAAVKLAETVPDGSIIVTILCDVGSRYLSTSVWEDGYA